MSMIKKSTSEGKIEILDETGEQFPESAQKFLNALYEARNCQTDDDKIACLIGITGLGADSETPTSHNLKQLEFYYLTRCKIL